MSHTHRWSYFYVPGDAYRYCACGAAETVSPDGEHGPVPEKDQGFVKRHIERLEKSAESLKKKTLGPFTFEIDRPKGTTKEWPGGKSFTYPVDYGFFPKLTGEDGEGLDAFVGDNPDGHLESFQKLKPNKDGKLVADETKYLLGVNDRQRETIYRLYGREINARRVYDSWKAVERSLERFEKEAAETEETPVWKEDARDAAGVAIAGLGAHSLAHGATENLLGAQKFYHGTGDAAAAAIRRDGLLASMGGNPNGSASLSGVQSYVKNSKGHVHIGTGFSGAQAARGYASLVDAKERNPLLSSQDALSAYLRGMGPGHKGTVLQGAAPYEWIASNFSPDPDSGGSSAALKGQVDIGASHISDGAVGLRDLYKNRAPDLLGYVKRNPRRVAYGGLMAGGSLAALYAAYRLGKSIYDRHREEPPGELGEKLGFAKTARVPSNVKQYRRALQMLMQQDHDFHGTHAMPGPVMTGKIKGGRRDMYRTGGKAYFARGFPDMDYFDPETGRDGGFAIPRDQMDAVGGTVIPQTKNYPIPYSAAHNVPLQRGATVLATNPKAETWVNGAQRKFHLRRIDAKPLYLAMATVRGDASTGEAQHLLKGLDGPYVPADVISQPATGPSALAAVRRTPWERRNRVTILPDSGVAPPITTSVAPVTSPTEYLTRRNAVIAGGTLASAAALYGVHRWLRSRRENEQQEKAAEAPADLSHLVGSSSYYLSRAADFRRRHPELRAPEYYYDYGDRYVHRFENELRPRLTPEGQAWFDKTKHGLQAAIEQKRVEDPEGFDALERNPSAFHRFAYDSHGPVYLNSGIRQLSLKDLSRVARTPDIKDVVNRDGLRLVGQIMNPFKKVAAVPETAPESEQPQQPPQKSWLRRNAVPIAGLTTAAVAAPLIYRHLRKQRLSNDPAMRAIQEASGGRFGRVIEGRQEASSAPRRWLDRLIYSGGGDVHYQDNLIEAARKSGKVPQVDGALLHNTPGKQFAQGSTNLIANRESDVVSSIFDNGNKWQEYQIFDQIAPGAMGKTENVADILSEMGYNLGARNPRERAQQVEAFRREMANNGGRRREVLERLQGKLKDRFGSGFLLKDIDAAATGGKFPSEAHNFTDLVNEDSPAAKTLINAIKDPRSVIAQEKLPLAQGSWLDRQFAKIRGLPSTQEVRVHVMNGAVAPDLTVPRFSPTMWLTGRKKMRGADQYVRDLLAQMPEEIRNGTYAMDIAPIQGGGFKLIESNPGYRSGFLSPGNHPLIGPLLHKQFTGRHSQTVSGLGAGAGALGAGAVATGATRYLQKRKHPEAPEPPPSATPAQKLGFTLHGVKTAGAFDALNWVPSPYQGRVQSPQEIIYAARSTPALAATQENLRLLQVAQDPYGTGAPTQGVSHHHRRHHH